MMDDLPSVDLSTTLEHYRGLCYHFTYMLWLGIRSQ